MRRAWGSIVTVEAGKKYRLRWVQNTPEGRRKMCETVRGTRKQATARLAEIQLACADDAPVPTVGECYERWWLPDARSRVERGKLKPSALAQYEGAWDAHARRRWGRVPVDSIRPIDVQEWLDTVPPGMARKAMIVLKGAVDFAVMYELVPSNKFRAKYSLRGERAGSKARDVLTLAGATDMLRSLRGELAEPAFILMAFGGCRVGESLGVRRSEVELRESHGLSFALVPVVRQMPPNGCEPTADGDLKTPQSVRTAIVPPPASTRLMELCALPGEWLADRGDGLPMSADALRRAWSRSSAIPPSNLRASWRTYAAFEWGIDPDVLEILMGHLIPTVTGKHYLRPSADDLLESFAASFAAKMDKSGQL